MIKSTKKGDKNITIKNHLENPKKNLKPLLIPPTESLYYQHHYNSTGRT